MITEREAEIEEYMQTMEEQMQAQLDLSMSEQTMDAHFSPIVLRETAFERKGVLGHKHGPFEGPESLVEVIMPYIKRYPGVESLWVLYTRTNNSVIDVVLTGVGSLDQCNIDPRYILRNALIVGATGMAIIHSHPSMNPEFSTADVAVAKDMQRACTYLNMKLTDFMVVNEDRSWRSAQKMGILNHI